MKKIIILLITVSIMLTSCGKSAGLSNGGKKAGNKSLVGTNNNNSSKQSGKDTIKRYWHTATNFVLDHKTGTFVAVGALILLSVAIYYRVNIYDFLTNKEQKEQVVKLEKKISDQADEIKSIQQAKSALYQQASQEADMHKTEKDRLEKRISDQATEIIRLQRIVNGRPLSKQPDQTEALLQQIQNQEQAINRYESQLQSLKIQALEKNNEQLLEVNRLLEENNKQAAEIERLKQALIEAQKS